MESPGDQPMTLLVGRPSAGRSGDSCRVWPPDSDQHQGDVVLTFGAKRLDNALAGTAERGARLGKSGCQRRTERRKALIK
jgi:hypothetical protein